MIPLMILQPVLPATRKVSSLRSINTRQAFTLIELMIVMAVIAILMGFILPSFKGMKEEAQHSRVLGDLRTLQTAVESYFIHHDNQYPPESTKWQDALLNASPKVLQKEMIDPFSTEKFPYAYKLNGFYYVIWSTGFKAEGKITDINPKTGKVSHTGSPIWVSNGDKQ